MPNLTQPLITNQQLLEELQKRLETGTIELDVDSEVEPASPSTSWLQSKYLLAIVIFAVIMFFYFQSSRPSNLAIKNTFQIKDKQKYEKP